MRLARRLLPLPLLLPLFLGCRGSNTSDGTVDTALLHKAGGDVMLAEGGRIDYEITSDRYRQWESARRGLRAAKIGLSMSLDPLRVSQRDIDRAVTFFERNGKARRIIEGEGMSVRDYVLTTLALEQQMAVANGRWSASERPRAPVAPVVPSESIAAELARDSARRADTVVVDSVPAPPDTTSPPDTTTSANPAVFER